MAKKRDNPKRPADRKPAVGGNLIWSLVAAGVASLFALSLVSVAPDVEISYSDLERLIAASATDGPDRFVTLQKSEGDAAAVRYGDLHDVTIGAFEVSGRIREAPRGIAAAHPADESTQPRRPLVGGLANGERRFRAAKLPSENSESELMKTLKEYGVPFRYEDPPSPWRNWLPMLFLTGLFGVLFFVMMRRIAIWRSPPLRRSALSALRCDQPHGTR